MDHLWSAWECAQAFSSLPNYTVCKGVSRPSSPGLHLLEKPRKLEALKQVDDLVPRKLNEWDIVSSPHWYFHCLKCLQELIPLVFSL